MKLDIEAKNQRGQHTGDIELPDWTGRLLRFLYLGAGLFLLASSLTLWGCSSAGASEDAVVWQPATDVMATARAQDIIAANSSALSAPEQDSVLQSMRVAELGDELRLVDFNNPLLTGRLGALYVIYECDGDRIFNRYLSQQLPEGIPVVQRSPRQQGEHPCLLINRLHQSLTDQQAIAQTTLCYDGATWFEANTAVVDESQF
jgi:hypothetical protein